MDVLDRKYFSIRQLGYTIFAVTAFTAVWAWRVSTIHHEFELLKQATELHEQYRKREDNLIREVHQKDIETVVQELIEKDQKTNERLDKKTGRIEEKLKTETDE